MPLAPPEPSAPSDDELEVGFSRLTAAEFPILILSSSTGVDLDALAARLGLPREVVASQRASIRGKLGIPPFEPLVSFLERTPRLRFLLQLGPDMHERSPDAVSDSNRQGEARTRHVLRIAIHDVQALGVRVRAEANALRELTEVVGRPAEWDAMAEESEAVAELADELLLLADAAIERGRRNDARVVRRAATHR